MRRHRTQHGGVLMSTRCHPLLAGLLSLLAPGLGHLACGERATGWAFLCITAGVLLSCLIFRSPSTWMLMGLAYLFIALATSRDAARIASGRPSTLRAGPVWSLVVMALVIGPFALPLIWQHERLSRRAKTIWTIIVVGVTLLSLLLAAAIGPFIDQLLEQAQQLS